MVVVNRLIDLKYIKNESNGNIKNFFRYKGITKFDDNDIDSIKKISDFLLDTSGFNVSFIIERLDKEFDLIKIGNKSVVNIELKTSEKDEDQCNDNYKILSKEYVDWGIDIFCYESKKNKIYHYNSITHILEKSDFEYLNNMLNKITKPIQMSIDINISSIYATPQFFLERNYSLSKSQEKLKKDIISNSEDKIILVSGRAGTGKTLLALDLYCYYEKEYKNVVFIAPFKMNNLISKDLLSKINIKTTRSFLNGNLDADLIIVDEAQRLEKEQYMQIKQRANKKVILFGDINQKLDYNDYFIKVYEQRKCRCFNLNQVIRTDDTFDYFAKKVLNISTNGIKNKRTDSNKIKIFMGYEQLPLLSDYIFIEPAKSKYYYKCENKCTNQFCNKIGSECLNYKTAFDIVGQEYQKVAMTMCKGYYIEDKQIKCKNGICYSNLVGQLYAIMTRAVDELIIIVDNIEIYNFLFEKKELI